MAASTLYEASVKSGSIAAGQTFNIVFNCGVNPVVFLNRIVGFSGSGARATVYRFPTTSGGTPVLNYNLDTTAFGSLATINSGVTVTATGGQVSATSFYRGAGGAPAGTYGSINGKRRLAPYNTYLLQFINDDAAAQTFDVYLRWYEGPQDDPGDV